MLPGPVDLDGLDKWIRVGWERLSGSTSGFGFEPSLELGDVAAQAGSELHNRVPAHRPAHGTVSSTHRAITDSTARYSDCFVFCPGRICVSRHVADTGVRPWGQELKSELTRLPCFIGRRSA